MMAYVSGFVGTDCYDLLHYLSRVCRVLGRKALLIDCSDRKALSYSIDNSMVPNEEIVDCHGVDFINGLKNIDLLSKYDYTFIDFGLNVNHPGIAECDSIYVVSDFQKHTIAPLQKLVVDKEQVLGLVAREYVGTKVKPEAILSQLPNLKFGQNIWVIPQAASNTACCLLTQYDSIFRFDKVTSEIKEFLFDFYVEDLDILKMKESDLKRVIKKASKGL